MELLPKTAALKAVLEAMPRATADPVGPWNKAGQPMALMFKVMGKTFAILATRKSAYVVLKCDPHLAEILREQYVGVGHKTHLDRRFWIAVDLDADVPMDEIERLAAASYDLVRAGLTKKQQAELAAIA
jgi:predicted DNA-binding protein (MmcQ/YjbR family)